MTETVIRNQSDLDALYRGVVDQFRSIRFEAFLQREMRRLGIYHNLQFGRDAGADSARWPPLAPSTIAKKGHAKILVEKGKLRASLVQPQADGAVRIIWDENGRAGLSFGTQVTNDRGVEYSQFHSEIDMPGKKLPTREHVGINPAYFDAFCVRAMDHVHGELTSGQ